MILEADLSYFKHSNASNNVSVTNMAQLMNTKSCSHKLSKGNESDILNNQLSLSADPPVHMLM